MDIEYLKEKYPDWIISVYKTGSSMLPWIDYPRDHDFIFYTQDIDNGNCWQDYLS